MSKPEVWVSAPQILFIGEPYDLVVEVTASEPTKVEYIDVRVRGRDGWSIKAGKATVSNHTTCVHEDRRLMTAGVLPKGTTRFPVRFLLPTYIPPTHEIRPAYSHVELRVHVSIPWQIDVRADHIMRARRPPPATVARVPGAVHGTSPWRSRVFLDPSPTSPRLELSLASSRVIAGEVLVGSCAVYHLDDGAPRTVDLILAPMLTLIGRGLPRERQGRDAIRASVELPAGSAGQGVPFRIQLPESLIPSFAAVTHELAWKLIARTGSLFSTKLELETSIEIVDAHALESTPPLREAPRLGHGPIADVFAELAAERGWHVDSSTHELAVRGRADDAELAIEYAYRGTDGAFLVSSVRHRSVGLGLSVSPSSALRHLFFRDVEIDIATWDRAHLVNARHAVQAIPFIRAVAKGLMAAQIARPGGGSLVRWSDDELVFERAVAEVGLEPLREIASMLEFVAAAVSAARPVITPPPDVTVDVAAWEALAIELGGELGPGDLSIEGTLRGRAVDVGLGWVQRQPHAIHVAVGDPDTASEALRALELALPRPASDILANVGAEAIVDVLTRWSSDIVDFTVHDGVALASILLPPGPRPVADAPRVRELAESLRAVLDALDPPPSPYR